jgi:hypothetical protein
MKYWASALSNLSYWVGVQIIRRTNKPLPSQYLWLLPVLMVAASTYGCGQYLWLLPVLMAAASTYGCGYPKSKA